MLVTDFHFDLPPELIAQEPSAERAASRLLYLRRADGQITHRTIADLPDCLRAGDVLVVNDTQVFPARLLGHRDPSGGAVECLLVHRVETDGAVGRENASDEQWDALVHPGQKLKPGARLVFDGAPPLLRGEVLERRGWGRRRVRLWTDDGSPVQQAVDRLGHVPLPPYIKREDAAADRVRYQTMFAAARGSIAAPTAGLHFDASLVAALRARGVQIVPITLHVGYGTFQPVRVERVEDHRLEAEPFEISENAARSINAALDEGRRIIAVGTTSTRTLEAVAQRHDGRLAAGRGATDLFIYPGFSFRVISGLLTNFHLPSSSLLMLVSAFAGRERVLAAYREAIARRYRFYSYGDAMLIL